MLAVRIFCMYEHYKTDSPVSLIGLMGTRALHQLLMQSIGFDLFEGVCFYVNYVI